MKIWKFLSSCLIGVIFLVILVFAVMQTKWAKQRIAAQLMSFAEQKGLHLSIGSIRLFPRSNGSCAT